MSQKCENKRQKKYYKLRKKSATERALKMHRKMQLEEVIQKKEQKGAEISQKQLQTGDKNRTKAKK